MGKRRRKIRRIVSDDDEDLEVEVLPVVKSREDEKIKREIPLVVTLESSSEENEEPIRYFELVFNSITSFILNLFVSVKENDDYQVAMKKAQKVRVKMKYIKLSMK